MFMKGEMTASVCRLNTDRSSEYKLLNERSIYLEQIKKNFPNVQTKQWVNLSV